MSPCAYEPTNVSPDSLEWVDDPKNRTVVFEGASAIEMVALAKPPPVDPLPFVPVAPVGWAVKLAGAGNPPPPMEPAVKVADTGCPTAILAGRVRTAKRARCMASRSIWSWRK